MTALIAPSSPGLHTRRLIALMEAAVERCRLDLGGAVVFTEAASGPYVVTPVLAAMAGARVHALVRASRYGSVDEVAGRTLALAELVGARSRLEMVTDKNDGLLGRADILTNSGHVRPIDAATVRALKPSAVIPLMYETWELRENDVDVEACRARGIRVAGTNERHPAIDVFSFLGMMAVKLLLDGGVAIHRSRILLLCDNPFAPFLSGGLTQAGAIVELCNALPVVSAPQDHDVILVALQPRPEPVLGRREADRIGACWKRAIVAQFWGDVDRSACADADVPVHPESAPAAGHMGILPSGLGPEPVIRLQSGGLKVGEVLGKWPTATADERAFAQLID